MPLPENLVIAIHDLNPWGGQDKSNLEILYALNPQIPIDLHAMSFVDQRVWPQLNHHPYSTRFNFSVFSKSVYYAWASFFKLQMYGTRRQRRQKKILIQSTGTAAVKADVIQVQYIHTSWSHILKQHSIQETESFLKNIYYAFFGFFNQLSEEFIYTPDKKYIAISHSIKKELMEEFQIPPAQIQTIYHGVNTDYFFPYKQDIKSSEIRRDIRAQLRLKDNDVALLHVGALNQRKGLFSSIKTLGHLKKHGVDNIHLIAVGAGDKKALQRAAAVAGVEKNLKIISHSKSVRDYYWASDIFFFPSIYEPFGLVILEAMACGLPSVISGTAGASELVSDREDAVIISNIFDHETMAQEILSLAKNPARREAMGSKAAQKARAHTWNIVAQNYITFYDDVFSESSK